MLHKITDSLRSIHNTIFTGKVLIRHERLPSTNAYLRDMLQNSDVAEGTVVWAGFQTSGRGQGTNKWEVEDGKNLTFSLLYKPVFLSSSNVFILNKMIALALLDVLSDQYSEHAWHIKWPNDILLDGKKVAGILIETSMHKQVESAIIGIGLNVNQREFPLFPHATSIWQASGQEQDPGLLLQAILSKLEAGYMLLRQEKTLSGIERRYLEHLWGYGEERVFFLGEDSFSATVQGVDASGMLLLDRAGQSLKFHAGSLVWKMSD